MSLIIGSSKQEMATEPLTNKPKGGDYDNSNYPNLVNKICVVKQGHYSPTFEQLDEYFETPKNEDAFPIYFIALADQHEHVDFETEVE